MISSELQNHWLWQDKPFAKGQAWTDLLLLSAKTQIQTIYRDKIYSLAIGQIITSENDLCNRWGWSRTKVRKFLELLEETLMVELVRDKRKTVITILKHSNIQPQDNKNRPNPIQESIQDKEQKKRQEKKQLKPILQQVIAKNDKPEKKPVEKQDKAIKSVKTNAINKQNTNTSTEILFTQQASEPYQLTLQYAIKREQSDEKQ
jgi:DNA-binding GntR family transcriptional regulator